MKLVAYDPKMLTLKKGPRMVPGGGERFLGPQGEEVRYSEDQPRDKDGKFASGGQSYEKDASGKWSGGVSSSDFTGSKNFLVAAYDKNHSSDFHTQTAGYSGNSTLKVPEGYKPENMIGFAQAVRQSDGKYAIQNVEVHRTSDASGGNQDLQCCRDQDWGQAD
jgi:hypothetical protein